MATDILVPTLGESVSEATIGRWFKKPGDAVAADEPLVELETDKVTLEVNAPAAGELGEILVKDGETVEPGALLGSIVEAGAGGGAKAPAAKKTETKADTRTEEATPKSEGADKAPAEESSAAYGNHGEAAAPKSDRQAGDNGPAVAKMARESGIDPSTVNGTGKDGRVTKGDMIEATSKAPSAPAPAQEPARQAKAPSPPRPASKPDDAAREERVKMTKPASDHRPPPQGRAEHRRHADHLQRGRHDRGDGTCARSTRTCSRRSTATSSASWASSPRPA